MFGGGTDRMVQGHLGAFDVVDQAQGIFALGEDKESFLEASASKKEEKIQIVHGQGRRKEW